MNREQVKINQESNGSYCLEIGYDKRHFYDLDVLLETVKKYLVSGNRLIPEIIPILDPEPLEYGVPEQIGTPGIIGPSGYTGSSGYIGSSGVSGMPGFAGMSSYGWTGSNDYTACSHCGYTTSLASGFSSTSAINLHRVEIVRNNEEGR